jgi:diacylglycerol kinase (ATP)
MSTKNKPIRVKLIANPGAGDVKEAAFRIGQVMQYLTDEGLKVDLALAHPKSEAIPIARKAVKDGFDVVVAMGGDGTLGAVISGIMDAKVKGTKTSLGIIAAGTSNDIATSLGIPKDLKEACALIASAHTRKLDIGRLTTKNSKNNYFFSVTAIGLAATIYPMIKELPEGKLAGIKQAVTAFLKFETKPKVYLTLDDESKIEVDTLLVTIANTPLMGLKNLLAPDASLDDGLLDIAVYPGFSKSDLLGYIALTADERAIPDGSIQRYQAKKIKIKTSPKLDIAAEGIIFGKGTATIKILPGALRVLAPEPGAGTEKPRSAEKTEPAAVQVKA